MAYKVWDSVAITAGTGAAAAAAPVVVSASRSTDIPAFHADWFVNRLRQGFCKWINPFNRQAQYVSFQKTRAIVFWTKNAGPLLPHLPAIDRLGINYYFTFTLNDYEQEGLEPGLPPLERRLATFAELAARIGKERVIWRFDPLILSDAITPALLLEKLAAVGAQAHRFTEKLVISFADIAGYAKVRRGLRRAGFNWREFTGRDIAELASGLQQLNSKWGLNVATCAEKCDLTGYGIVKNKCIDDELLKRLFGHDEQLMAFLAAQAGLKDKGQRAECGCIASKDIGQYDTCPHSCLYCYANTPGRPATAAGNPENETIF